MKKIMLSRSTIKSTVGIGLISSAALAFEISLTRLFAVQQFHHFAFVVVSLAVMGMAASGLALAIQPQAPPLSRLSTLFSISIAIAFLTINGLPFDSYSIAWDRGQVGILFLYFLTAGLPFFFAGWTVGACLAEAGRDAHRPYAANLIGSALGCLVALLALATLGGEGATASAISLGLLAALVFSSKNLHRIMLASAAAVTFILGVISPSPLHLRLSPYKPLNIARLAPDAQTTVTTWSASSRIDVVESSSVHVLPGLSLNAVIELPEQAAVFIDGDGPLPITNLSPDDPNTKTIAAHMPATLAYVLRENADSLILQPGTGFDLLVALAVDAGHVTTTIDEPLIFEILSGPYAEASHQILQHPKLTVIPRPSRSALRSSGQRFDVIQFALSRGFRPVTSGAFSLTEEYLLTVDALREAYQKLEPGGLLVMTHWLGTPPSESVRAWATLLAALNAAGDNELDQQLIAYRGMRTATMIATNQAFTSEELSIVRGFLQRNAFDPIYLPDLDPSELNQFNQLPVDTYHEVYSALLKDATAVIEDYDFNLRPPTDGRPFFFHFFRWRQTPAVVAGLGLTWQPFGGSGYLVLLALLGLMLLLALPLVIIPLLLLKRKPTLSLPNRRVMMYFACLGIGYLLVEIPLIQQFTLLLDRPALSLAIVLFTLLLASGAGSLFSPRIPLRLALGILLPALALTTATIPLIINAALPWGMLARVATAVLFLIPAGFLMGVPFAVGLRDLESQSPGAIPWAWGINGAFSGVSGVLAAMISLDAGLAVTMLVGAMAYLGAWLTAPRQLSVVSSQ
jgi:hypothetical protein